MHGLKENACGLPSLQSLGLTIVLGFTVGTVSSTATRLGTRPSLHPSIGQDTAPNVPSGALRLLWRDPGDISALDLVNGAGGSAHAPGDHDQYKYIKEDLGGTSTKFYIEYQNGVRWLVKLGEEVHSETAATRFVWAMGYFVDEDYYLPQFHVDGMGHLHRGSHDIHPDGTVIKGRLERVDKQEGKEGTWDWTDNPFLHTRELEGLRVLMAFINNWDLKNSNNKIRADGAELHYEVADLGSSFGRTGAGTTRSKANVKDYQNAMFIQRAGPDDIDFVMRTSPFSLLKVVYGKKYQERKDMELLVKHVPRADAKWMGEQLSRLRPTQIADAFRAAGFSMAEVEGYTQAVLNRIAALKAL